MGHSKPLCKRVVRSRTRGELGREKSWAQRSHTHASDPPVYKRVPRNRPAGADSASRTHIYACGRQQQALAAAAKPWHSLETSREALHNAGVRLDGRCRKQSVSWQKGQGCCGRLSVQAGGMGTSMTRGGISKKGSRVCSAFLRSAIQEGYGVGHLSAQSLGSSGAAMAWRRAELRARHCWRGPVWRHKWGETLYHC
jgi:hypothetical protein